MEPLFDKSERSPAPVTEQYNRDLEATKQSGNQQPNEMIEPYQAHGPNTPAELNEDGEQSQNQIAEAPEES